MKRLQAILLQTIIWGLAGIIFGGSFVALHDILPRYTHEFTFATIMAAAISGTITSSYFGAIREALLGSFIGLFLAVSFLMYWGAYEIKNPEIFLLTTFLTAFISGAFFPKTTIFRDKPLAQAASGLISGLIAGVVIVFFGKQVGVNDSYFILALFGVSLVGVCYMIVSDLIMSQCRDWMTSLFSAPIVSATSATASAWAILLVTNTDLDILQAIENIPDGVMGGLVGGAAGGFVLTLLGIKDKNDYHL